jgi:hypothetical protein
MGIHKTCMGIHIRCDTALPEDGMKTNDFEVSRKPTYTYYSIFVVYAHFITNISSQYAHWTDRQWRS